MAGEDWEPEAETASRESRKRKEGPPWIAGGILLMMGLLLLVSNITGRSFDNWWALFILIPALGSLYVALRHYTETGTMSEDVRKPLVGGLILLVVSLMFLFNLSWSNLWPFLLIIAGGGLLLTALWPERG